jgi:hypothetical protein
MRGAYLLVSNGKNGSRGGVGSNYGNGEYELEIGQSQSASTKMIALCAHYDEIVEHLGASNSHIGQLILSSIKKEELRLNELYDQSVKNQSVEIDLR